MSGDGPPRSRWVPVMTGIAGAVIGVLVTLMVVRFGVSDTHTALGTTSTSTSTPTSTHAQAQDAGCGPDQQAALEAAFVRLPPEPVTGHDWSGIPKASNYRPCADLSAILVTVLGATGSSPTKALLFHHGTYVGPATAKAYGFTDLDAAASTDDTVVLTYRSGQSCTACGDGVVTTVRYRWDGTGVQILDPLPPG